MKSKRVKKSLINKDLFKLEVIKQLPSADEMMESEVSLYKISRTQ